MRHYIPREVVDPWKLRSSSYL